MTEQLQNTETIADLNHLNEQINEYETIRYEAAIAFFTERLHEKLHFKKADNNWITKEDFINGLKDRGPFESRTIKYITVLQSEPGFAIVTCIVVGIMWGETVAHEYRNIRIFKLENGKWLLHSWYNYELTQPQKLK